MHLKNLINLSLIKVINLPKVKKANLKCNPVLRIRVGYYFLEDTMFVNKIDSLITFKNYIAETSTINHYYIRKDLTPSAYLLTKEKELRALSRTLDQFILLNLHEALVLTSIILQRPMLRFSDVIIPLESTNKRKMYLTLSSSFDARYNIHLTEFCSSDILKAGTIVIGEKR